MATYHPATVERTVRPSTEVLTLAEAKAQLRITHDLEDTYLSELIPCAREACENFCQRSFATQTFQASFLNPDLSEGTAYMLPFPTVRTIVSVSSLDSLGASTLYPSGNYFFSANRLIFRVQPNSEAVSLTVTYTSGPLLSSNVKRHSIALMLANLYENRTPAITGTIAAEIPYTLRALLTPLRVPNV